MPALRVKNPLVRDGLMALVLLGLFLLTHGYQYAWDDQHLEIPLLKSLIDPQLYVGDYYVESLKKNFTSFFYPVLAHFITIDQIPAVYFSLYLISRYLLFFFSFKLWNIIARNRMEAFGCVAASIVLLRSPEFLYRTFSHQEFSLWIIFAGLYLFYRERIFAAAMTLGFAANIHGLYSLFPMIYMLVDLAWNFRTYGWRKFFIAGILFVALASPFIIWNLGKYSHGAQAVHPPANEWIPLALLACPQNFLFNDIPLELIGKNLKVATLALKPYLFLVVFYLLVFFHHHSFKRDRKIQSIAFATLVMLIVSFFFTYMHPIRFVVDLNLVRNTQFLSYFLMGYTVLLAFQVCHKNHWLIALVFVAMLSLLNLDPLLKIIVGLFLFALLFIPEIRTWSASLRKKILLGIVCISLAGLVFSFVYFYRIFHPGFLILQKFGLTLGALSLWGIVGWFGRNRYAPLTRTILYPFFPILVATYGMIQIHWHHYQAVKQNQNFWGLQNAWEDMQYYVRDHTPKNSFFLVPNDMEMGGFRILSERKVLVCYRDCGIIGFDYQAAVQWQKRLSDVEPFKVLLDHGAHLERALYFALQVYKVNYIVFMHYYAPPASVAGLQKMYDNEYFSLYRVLANPTQD